MIQTEHQLFSRLCWMLGIQDGHSTFPKGTNNYLRNSKVWNSIRIWNPRSKVESDQPRKEEVAWSVVALGGCSFHSCCLMVRAARRKSEVSAITCFPVPASAFTHSPQRLEGSLTEAIPGGEPRTHSKVFEVHEYCLSNVLLWMGIFHFDYIFTDIFLVTLCYPCSEPLIQSVKKNKIKKQIGGMVEKIENTGPLDLGQMDLIFSHLEGNWSFPHQIRLCALWLELGKIKVMEY